MSQYDGSVYGRPRVAKGFTQEKAAELVGVSVESIRAYECGIRVPPDQVVIRMVEVYDAPHLAYQHLRNAQEVARLYLPQIQEGVNLEAMVLRLQKEIRDFIRVQDELIDITCDGEISAEEWPRFKKILKELDDINTAIMTMRFNIRE